ncbi:cysteine rich repeat-containing protein [Ancylobacter sp. TS-1]|uniref:cysteine rich repeat-containing protein n=1 Tax=Ancylobacter sp. TS-1 TaxID=1850374 RepID=UPI001FEE8272|nr:cysteine rich repeat-containing protein [Ancylobacter sp. TS-1]
MRRDLLIRGLIVVVFATMAGAAFAQNLTRSQQQALRTACEADIRSVCAGIQPGGGRLLQCIRANPDKISQGCKDALASAKAAQAQ